MAGGRHRQVRNFAFDDDRREIGFQYRARHSIEAADREEFCGRIGVGGGGWEFALSHNKQFNLEGCRKSLRES